MSERSSWFREYCEKTTSNGMQYFAMNGRSLIEKIFWTLTFFCMILVTYSSLKFMMNIWITSPTVMFIENTESSIRDIPFPSIMICSTNQLRKSVWEEYRDANTTYWDDLQRYQYFVCYQYLFVPKWKNVLDHEYLDYETTKRLYSEFPVSCSELFQSDIKWQNNMLHNSCQYIQPIITIVGLCFKINMMPIYHMLNEPYHKKYVDFFSKNYSYIGTEKSNWNLDDGYSQYLNNSTLLEVIPFRTGGISYYHRLRLMMYNFDEDFLGCSNRSLNSGFMMALNNPADYYSFKTRSFILLETYKRIQIIPFVKKISENLMWRSLEVRKCYLHDERKLSIFKLYSEANCNIECGINESISMCGCASHQAVYLVGTSVKICGPPKRACVLNAIQTSNLPKFQEKCNCLPTCSTIEYGITDTYHYDNWTYMRSTNLVKNSSRGATVEIIFKNPYFIAYKSSSILNFDSFISTIGGMLSLFLGINLINIFEMLYVFITTINNYIVKIFNRQ